MPPGVQPAGVVLAGGGLAAVRTAQALRDLGHAGPIRLVSAEPTAPYDRPPLSKDVLLGRAGSADAVLLDAAGGEALGIELRLGSGATALDAGAQRITLASGERLRYDALVIASGARARRLALLDGRPDVFLIRDAGDAAALGAALAARPRVAVVGGGFIGLEVTAAAATLGCAVTVVEAADEPLAPVLGAELGAVVRGWHERHGVVFARGRTVAAVRATSAGRELVLDDGSAVPADVVVVGVGAEPAVGWLAGSGLELHRGVRCDEHGRTSLPHVFAAGDVACRHVGGTCVPGGHWTGTNEQARRVAAALLGRPDPRPAELDGYFWSDQYGSRLQFAGRAGDGARLVSGTFDGAFVATWSAGGRVIGVLARDDPRGFIRARVALRRAAAPGAAAA